LIQRAFDGFGFAASPYKILINAGLLVGLAFAYVIARRVDLEPLRAVDASLVAMCGSLVTGRAAYVAANWDYFQQYPWRAVRVWQGGLSWHGALVGALLAILGYCAIRSLPIQLVLTALSPSAAVLSIFAWLACLAGNQAYGQETFATQKLLWKFSLELPDIYGTEAPRVAVQWLGVAWGVIVLATVTAIVFSRQWRRSTFPSWLALQGLGSAALSLVRADEVPMLGNWRVDTIVDLTLDLCCCSGRA